MNGHANMSSAKLTVFLYIILVISGNSYNFKLRKTKTYDCSRLQAFVSHDEIKLDYAQQPKGTSLSAAILDLDRRQGKVEEGNFSKKGRVITAIRVLVLLSRYYMIQR